MSKMDYLIADMPVSLFTNRRENQEVAEMLHQIGLQVANERAKEAGRRVVDYQNTCPGMAIARVLMPACFFPQYRRI